MTKLSMFMHRKNVNPELFIEAENAVKRSCIRNKLLANSDAKMPFSPKGKPYRVAWELVSASDKNIRGIVALKTQEGNGTAEEKVPYAVIQLLTSMDADLRYKKAWIILSGSGFTPFLMNYFANDLHKKIPDMREKVYVVSDENVLRSIYFDLI